MTHFRIVHLFLMHNRTKQATHNVTLNPATLKTIARGIFGSMAEGCMLPISSAVIYIYIQYRMIRYLTFYVEHVTDHDRDRVLLRHTASFNPCE